MRFVLLTVLMLSASVASAATPHASRFEMDPITIEQPGYTATISFDYGDETTTSLLDYKALPFAFIALALLSLVALQQQRLRRLEKAVRTHTEPKPVAATAVDNPFAEAVVQLCDRNQLKRLSAIHHIGQIGLDRPSYRPRAATLLAVYVRAISKDSGLRRKAMAEIMATLEELSMLNRAARHAGSPLRVNLEGCNFSGLVLQDMDFAGMNLSKTTWSDTTVIATTMASADLTGAILSETRFEAVDAMGLKIKGAVWRKVTVASDVRGLTQQDVLIAEQAAPAADTPKEDILASPRSAMVATPRKDLFLNPDMPTFLDKTKLH